MPFRTKEEAHTILIEAIEYELNHYGPASLLDVIATIISGSSEEPRYQDIAKKLERVSLDLEPGRLKVSE